MVHGARLIGPAIAGFVIAAVGEGWCFFIDGISYIGVIAALLAMRIRPAKVRLEKTSARSDLVEGFKYVWHFTPVRALLLLMSLVSLTGVPALMTLMPTFADHLSRGHSGPATLGILMGASGVLEGRHATPDELALAHSPERCIWRPVALFSGSEMSLWSPA